MPDSSAGFGASIAAAIAAGLVAFVGSIFKERTAANRKARALEVGSQLMTFSIQNFDARAKVKNPTDDEVDEHNNELLEIHNGVYRVFEGENGRLNLLTRT